MNTPAQYAHAIRLADLPPSQINILNSLLLRMLTSDTCWPSMKTLSGDTGLSLATVERHIPKLHRTGWIAIERVKTRQGVVNRYKWGATLTMRVGVPSQCGEGSPHHEGLKYKGESESESKICGTAAGGFAMKCAEVQGKAPDHTQLPVNGKNAGIVFAKASSDYTESFTPSCTQVEMKMLKKFQGVPGALKVIQTCVREWDQFMHFCNWKNHPPVPSVGALVKMSSEAIAYSKQETPPELTQEEIDLIVAGIMAEKNMSKESALEYAKAFGDI